MIAHHPLKYRWSGEVMEPLVPSVANAQFTAGETYRLEVWEERSANSHNHYFAALNEGWLNLPDIFTGQFPTSEHLRKWLLIRTGHRDERTIVTGSKAEARRLAAFIRPMDEFAVVQVHEASISVFTAKSQSARAMGRAAFQKSKSDVLDALAEMIGVERKTLDANAGKAA